MNDDLIFSKEAARGAKRWSPGALTGAGGTSESPALRPDPAAAEAARVAELRNRALRQGFEQGFATGELAAREQAERLAELASAMQAELGRMEKVLAERLLELAIDIARQVVRTELVVHRDALLAVVHEAIRSVPEGTLNGEVLLHPSDADLVRTRMHEELKLGLWRIVPSPALEPGSVRITTRQCDVDATMATRWLRAMQSLGRDDAWRKPPHEGTTEGRDDAAS